MLMSMGARVTNSVSGRTSVLVVGRVLEDGKKPEQGMKYRTALEKGVRIVLEEELDGFLKEKCGKDLG
jgi:NAD-dependent DNA ligase